MIDSREQSEASFIFVRSGCGIFVAISAYFFPFKFFAGVNIPAFASDYSFVNCLSILRHYRVCVFALFITFGVSISLFREPINVDFVFHSALQKFGQGKCFRKFHL